MLLASKSMEQNTKSATLVKQLEMLFVFKQHGHSQCFVEKCSAVIIHLDIFQNLSFLSFSSIAVTSLLQSHHNAPSQPMTHNRKRVTSIFLVEISSDFWRLIQILNSNGRLFG